MARRPEDSIESIGESLLSQQADRRKKAEKRRRRDQKKLMLMGTLVAGQSLVNSALKRRAKEIADLGEMSKFKSKAQAENMAFYAPIFQSMEGAETFEDWKKTVGNDSGKYRALQGHLSPLLIANAKQQIGPDAADPVTFNREYAALKDTITNNLIEQAYGKDAQGRSYKDLFSQGATKFAASTGVDPVSKDALFEFLSNTTQNSVDAYKAQELNRRNGNMSTSVFSKDAIDTFLNASTFGLIKREKGESNPFKSISSRESLLPTELQTVFDGYNVNQIIKKEFASNYATMRDEVEAFANNAAAVKSMDGVWANMVARVKRGTFMDFYSVAGSERRKGSGHRHTAHSESMIENVYDFVNDRLPVKTELLNQSGALANMIGDPQRPKMKESIMDRWLELPEIKTLGITKGDQEYREVLGQLDTVIGRQEFALDFVTSLSIRNEKILGFEVDFSEIKSITEPKFEISKEGEVNKFVPTEIYNSLSIVEKEVHYNSYLQAILRNQTRSKNTPEQLRAVALQFMQDVPPPDGRTPEEIMATIFEPAMEKIGVEDTVRDADISMGFREPTPFSNPATLAEDQRKADERLAELFGEKKNLTDLDPSINIESVTPVIEWSFSSGRLNQPMEKANLVTNQLLQAIIQVESEFNYDAINTEAISTAVGGGQFLKDSLVTAVNRANNIREKNNLPPLPQTQAIKDNDARINKLIAEERSRLEARQTPEKTIKAELQKIAKREFQSKDSIARQISPEVQQELILANLFEADGSDAYWKRLLNATTPEEQYEAALDLYLDKHHTNRKDKKTVKRARKEFKPYFLN
jgi:hypothetical protein